MPKSKNKENRVFAHLQLRVKFLPSQHELGLKTVEGRSLPQVLGLVF